MLDAFSVSLRGTDGGLLVHDEHGCKQIDHSSLFRSDCWLTTASTLMPALDLAGCEFVFGRRRRLLSRGHMMTRQADPVKASAPRSINTVTSVRTSRLPVQLQRLVTKE